MTSHITTALQVTCPVTDGVAPPILDEISFPSVETSFSQVLVYTPRGAAWGTDEANDGWGASPHLWCWWRAVAATVATSYGDLFIAVQQSIPSLATWSIPEWELELGLPDKCTPLGETDDARRARIVQKHSAFGGASPAYFICLAKSFGYGDVSIEELDAFTVDDSEVDGADEVADVDLSHYWIVSVSGLKTDFFYADEGEVDVTPLEDFSAPVGIECLFREQAPVHTTPIFNYV